MTDMAQFTTALYQQLNALPRGRVVAYGQLAALAGYPGYARQAGAALRDLPADSSLAWYRVVKADGQLAFPIGSEAFNTQKQLLLQEGIELQANKVSRRYFLTAGVKQPYAT